MASRPIFSAAILKSFDLSYDPMHEYKANRSRAEFIKSFPISSIGKMKLPDYVIGHQTPTFCAHVEAKTRLWANILGATAIKFGIYYGKTAKDEIPAYRFSKKFGTSKSTAYHAVRTAIVDLIDEGGKDDPDFALIDANKLSQLFKAKILSLYFPERFLNVCSSEHLRLIGEKFGYKNNLLDSEYQHILLIEKARNAITKNWSNPKFMSLIYKTYINVASTAPNPIKSAREKSHPEVNFEDMQAQWKLIGKAAEEFALEWEKQRLGDAGLKKLIEKIDDRTKRPSYGYDFLSHSSVAEERFIEVKSVAKTSKNGDYRFYLSANEHAVSLTKKHCDEYFFYLVFFNSDSKPESLLAVRANSFYSEIIPEMASYIARFNIDSNVFLIDK